MEAVLRPVKATLLAAFLLVGVAACSGSDGGAPKDQWGQYEEALDDLLDGNYTEAATKFESVASSTLSPVLSQVATLRLGDALFFQGRYAEAAEVFREFLIQFSNSPDVGHAAYMKGLCYLEKMPEDTLIHPPAESRQMEDVQAAYDSFAFLVDRYPDSFHALRARQALARCLERKCLHHLYVAHYYEKKDRPKAVIQRIETALKMEETEKQLNHLPDSHLCAATTENFLLLARAYYQIGDRESLIWLEGKYGEYVDRYPQPDRGLEKIRQLRSTLKADGNQPGL